MNVNKVKAPMIVMFLYVLLVTSGPSFFYGLFYILYYADAMGDSSDYHCVVDLTGAAKMSKPVPLAYKESGITTEGLPDFIAKHPDKYVDVTENWRGMMLFGLIVQVILFLQSCYSVYRFEPNPDLQKDKVSNGLNCIVGIANLTQIIMTLVARCGYAGSICAGDYLPDPPTKEFTKVLPYYEKDDGKFLFTMPIVMLVMIPAICCLSMIVLPMIILWAV